MMRILAYFFVLFTTNSLLAQEFMMTNYIKPSDAIIRGKVDSIFEANFNVHDDEAEFSNYVNYFYDKNGHLINFSSTTIGDAEPTTILSVYEKEVIQFELVSLPFYGVDTNKIIKNNKAQVVEIKNSDRFIRFKYDKKGRITQLDKGYNTDNFILHSLNYKYITNDTYTVTESSNGNIYATREYVNGKYSLEIFDNILGGSDITTFTYNENGDLQEMQITSFNGNEMIYTFEYEYDERGNWIKNTQWIQYPKEERFVEKNSTRNLYYADGVSTGYEIEY